jgi:hypothetical protein
MRIIITLSGIASVLGSIRRHGGPVSLKMKSLKNGRELNNVFSVTVGKMGTREVLLDLENDVTWISSFGRETGPSFQCDVSGSDNKAAACVGKAGEELHSGSKKWKDTVYVARINDIVQGSIAATPNSQLNNFLIVNRRSGRILLIEPSNFEFERLCPNRVAVRLLGHNWWSFQGRVEVHNSDSGFESDVTVRMVSRPGVLELPKGVWGDFFGQMVKAGVSSIEDVNGGIYRVPKCDVRFPVLRVSGEDGTLFRIRSSKYTKKNDDGSCLLYVREGKSNTMSVGMDFIPDYGVYFFGPGKQIAFCK